MKLLLHAVNSKIKNIKVSFALIMANKVSLNGSIETKPNAFVRKGDFIVIENEITKDYFLVK